MNKKNKIANHVSPKIHEEVNKIIADPTQTYSQVTRASDAHLLARRLLQSLPIVPTSERIYELAQEIEIGLFDDLGTVENAYDNWQAWQDRTLEILKSQKILLAAINMDVDYYKEAKSFISNIQDEDKFLVLLNEIYNNIDKNKEYTMALAEEGLKSNILSQYDYKEIENIINA